jgi:hypothetical protein
MNRVFQHWRTSLGGVASAVLLWWYSTGFKMPETKQEWAGTIGGILMAITGMGVRDPGTTQPQGGDDARSRQ